MKTVLSTRSLSEKDIAYARSLDLEIQCEDFIEVKIISFDDAGFLKNDFDSVVFTSSNAVKALMEKSGYKEWLKSKNIFSISGKTNEELLKSGIHAVTIANDAETLANKIVQGELSKNILHPCGNLTLDILKTKMNQSNIKYHPLIIYKIKLKSIKLEKEYDAVLFFSPSGVESFFTANKLGEQTIVCCIGERTVKTLKEKQALSKIIIPDFPSPESMIEVTANYFQKNKAKA